MGRPRRDRRHRRALGARRHGPQRPQAHALHGHRRRPAVRRLRDRHGAHRRVEGGREGPHRPRPDDRRRPDGGPLLPRPRDQGHARQASALRQVGEEHRRDRLAHQAGPRRERRVRTRRLASASDRRRLVDGGPRAHPPAHGRGRQGADGLDGRRHADRGAVRPLPRPASLLPAELQPGHQSADRLAARGAGDDAEDAARQPRQHPRRGREPVPPAAARVAGAAQSPSSRRCAPTWATPPSTSTAPSR